MSSCCQRHLLLFSWCVSVPAQSLLSWRPVCKHRSGFPLWEMPPGIHWSRDHWGRRGLRQNTQTGKTKLLRWCVELRTKLCVTLWSRLLCPGVRGHRRVLGASRERRLHCQLRVSQHHGKTRTMSCVSGLTTAIGSSHVSVKPLSIISVWFRILPPGYLQVQICLVMILVTS